MASPTEAFRNAFRIPELRQRIFFTLVMLAVYSLGRHVATPGIDGTALAERVQTKGLGFFTFVDLFSGGAFQRATVFALGIMPYITASIIFSMLVYVIPSLEKLAKEGQEGQKKINEYTRYATIVLCIIQSIGTAALIQNWGAEAGKPIVVVPTLLFYFMCIVSFTTGTAFIMWLGEQISEYGIGNGISLLIFTSIVSRMPAAFFKLIDMIHRNQIGILKFGILIFVLVGVVAAAILITTGQRRVPVQYPRQVKGRRVAGSSRNYLPLRVNQAGVIPIIFASSILMLPLSLGSVIQVQFLRDLLNRLFYPGDSFWYNFFYAILIIFFSFFYTKMIFNPAEIADNMKKYGGVIMGVRPGKATAEYLWRVMKRVTLVGSVFLAAIALFPTFISSSLGIVDQTVTSFFGGTSLLILVGVALDTVRQIEQHLIMRHYDGFSPKGRRIRARR